jgi:hypothetical protein
MDSVVNTIEQVLTLFDKYGINPLIIGSIIFITTMLKMFDKKNKFKAGILFYPLILSLLIFAMIKPFEIVSYITKACAHAGISAYGYDLYKKLSKKKKE